MGYENLLKIAMSSVTFKEGVKRAKYGTPQRFMFHSTSVATLAYEICRAIYEMSDIGKATLDELAKEYGMPWEQLCFFGGFIHDWNKLPDGAELDESARLAKKEEEARKIMSRILELTNNSNVNPDYFIRGVAKTAEGHLPDSLHLPLWIGIKLGDMLMISDIRSVNDVYYFMNSPLYSPAVNALKSVYGIELRTLSSSPRLFTLIASKRIIEELRADSIPLISYTDGIAYLARSNSQPITLSKLYDVLERVIFGTDSGDENLNYAKEMIDKCLKHKISLFRELELNPSIIDDKNKIKQIPNSLFPSGSCKPFEDIIALLKPESISKLIDILVNEYREEAPWALILYFTEKSKKKEEIKKELGIGHVREYVKTFKSEELLEKLAVVLKKIYSQKGGFTDLLSFVRKSFSGDIMDDLPSIMKKPISYCVVCGMPIYEEGARFSQYGFILGLKRGATEIFNPRAKAMEEIDKLRDDWKICPICYFEATSIASITRPPFALVSFYPGVPIKLLESLYIGTKHSDDVFKKVMENSTYYDVFVSSGGEIRSSVDQKILISYLSSKVLVPFMYFTGEDMKISTRLAKNDMNDLMRYVPFLSIAYLASPVIVTTTIADIPIEEDRIKVESVFNYSWTSLNKQTNDDANYKTLLTLLAYKAKYDIVARLCGSNDIENCISSMVEESDLYYAVDPSLFMISLGLGVGSINDKEEGKLIGSISHDLNFLNFVMKEVSPMGETLSSSIEALSSELVNIIKGKPSKYDVIGFFRDGVDMFFRTSSLELKKEDRINLAVSVAISSLENKYYLNDDSESNISSALQSIFEKLYDIENNSDRSLAIRVANSLATWLYLQFLNLRKSGEKK